jgi:hypothetical protein
MTRLHGQELKTRMTSMARSRYLRIVLRNDAGGVSKSQTEVSILGLTESMTGKALEGFRW